MPAVNKVERGLAVPIGILGGLTLLGSIGTLLTQAVMWLRDGHWMPLPWSLVWNGLGGKQPDYSWAGVQKIALFILDLPLSLGFVLLGLLILKVVNEFWE
jgi:hypothetical protein